jgi:hypothetical protein
LICRVDATAARNSYPLFYPLLVSRWLEQPSFGPDLLFMLPAQLDATKVSASPLSPADLCHPTLHRGPFTAAGWLFELKHDGFRAFARTGPAPELMSRWGRSMAPAFPEIVRALESLPADAVLDAELVVPDTAGRADWEELRRRSLMRRPSVMVRPKPRRRRDASR